MNGDYRLCLPLEAAEKLVEECSAANPEALEMKEHRNCLVGLGHFMTAGIFIQRDPSLFAIGAMLTGEDLQDALDLLDDDSPGSTVSLSLQPYLVGTARRCGEKTLPVICFSAVEDPLAALEIQPSIVRKMPVLVYDSRAIVANLQTADGLSEEEAWEHFEFNIVGAWVGQGTPLFL